MVNVNFSLWYENFRSAFKLGDFCLAAVCLGWLGDFAKSSLEIVIHEVATEMLIEKLQEGCNVDDEQSSN